MMKCDSTFYYILANGENDPVGYFPNIEMAVKDYARCVMRERVHIEDMLLVGTVAAFREIERRIKELLPQGLGI